MMCAQLLKPLRYCLNPISFIISFHVLLINFPISLAQIRNYNYYSDCSNTTTIRCGDRTFINPLYPFWGKSFRPAHCGLDGFELHCENNDLVVDIGSRSKYHVVDFNSARGAVTLNRSDDPLGSICASGEATSTVLNATLYDYTENTEDLNLFYNCDDEIDSVWLDYTFTCKGDSKKRVYFFLGNSFELVDQDKIESCTNTTIQVDKRVFDALKNNRKEPETLFNRSFEVHYNRINEKACVDCKQTEGLCWRGTNTNDNTCLYSNGTALPPYKYGRPGLSSDEREEEPHPPGSKKSKGLIIGAAIGGVGILLFLMAVVFILYRRKNPKQVSYAVSRNVSSYSFSMSDSEKGSGTYMGVRTFSYNELEKATNNFDASNELGDGGFGTVYKGKLQDGREVAVKRLYENSMKRVEQFMNEIVILTQLRHPNLVVLYGSTSQECRKLLLVYEYIPNGTIADHLYGEDAERGKLTWKTRMSIAIQTASALSYLHVSDVIHRDVKTTNILLDDNFHVKVADFGLSRLFPVHATHVSTAPQGTPGYVDPEYHQCYQLTSKSDVYSFGVVLIELISSKPAVDITRHRHEINLANLAINKIQGNALHELVDPSLGFESDYEVKRMITEVAELAFRCLQNDRELRPSMDEVHKSLKEIQSRNYSGKHETEHNLSADHVSLLKNYPQNHSPDSVTIKWGSNSTNTSSSN
ncbi:LEAF RUST 10 DISEASE-RESISTANCE LOCUS RECEPTOR-LIKE PROTEIN KINASE-like 1.1 isoform X2 [Daucus carota subsp. sativus]|uniref:LEAF RUST 10 DISEASE-RESISTANCE LOCUS RECEPTOR-LIKE PROTEIN KINASE-like 1.1 isoform X2 n=1 Tax=Daucus carota subsp. sativus TaxID=79200 RepID=UPI0007F02578|nr:PREDICTED: LEAF RUST 10 DISEASE-RESISTANCE LOCUS RECEPTOR-LIKE PROTEIN KINASE-like 1.1 isoform X2 [Daucus carota subsp. sativus]